MIKPSEATSTLANDTLRCAQREDGYNANTSGGNANTDPVLNIQTTRELFQTNRWFQNRSPARCWMHSQTRFQWQVPLFRRDFITLRAVSFVHFS